MFEGLTLKGQFTGDLMVFTFPLLSALWGGGRGTESGEKKKNPEHEFLSTDSKT